VVVLIAEGHTNLEIRQALVTTEWTVDTHVRHILTRLQLRSRAQVAALGDGASSPRLPLLKSRPFITPFRDVVIFDPP
jgi:hypothetical protein